MLQSRFCWPLPFWCPPADVVLPGLTVTFSLEPSGAPRERDRLCHHGLAVCVRILSQPDVSPADEARGRRREGRPVEDVEHGDTLGVEASRKEGEEGSALSAVHHRVPALKVQPDRVAEQP
jgi:hypothetical protein